MLINIWAFSPCTTAGRMAVREDMREVHKTPSEGTRFVVTKREKLMITKNYAANLKKRYNTSSL
jgi:hypothetical protein